MMLNLWEQFISSTAVLILSHFRAIGNLSGNVLCTAAMAIKTRRIAVSQVCRQHRKLLRTE